MPPDEQIPDILIADDNPDNLRFLKEILSSTGYRIRFIPDSSQALASARLKPPELILLDIKMPGMSGYEVCRHLKADDATRDIPVIFLSVLDDTQDKLTAFAAGGVDYITKPFESEEVLARVAVHLRLRQLQRRVEEQNRSLHEQNERYRALEQAAFDGIFMHEKGNIAEVSDTMARMFGYSREEMIGLHLSEIIKNPAQKRYDSDILEARGIRKDRTHFPLELREKSAFFHGHEARVSAVRDISREQTLEEENRGFRLCLDDRDHFGKLVGKSPAMRRVYDRIVSAAASEGTVLIYGETGSGKEVAARMIFEMSGHHTREFLSINCSAVQESLFESQFFGYCKGAFTGAWRDTPGYFERISGGTLFLDEIGELTPAMQAKLLRILEDGEYIRLGETRPRTADVRIIAATNREIRGMVRSGEMREDFFQRIHMIVLEMPPLRLRKEDIPLLAEHFLKQHALSGSASRRIPGHLMDRFMAYEWPGNVRELFNELHRYLTVGEVELRGTALRKDRVPEDAEILPEGLSFQEIMENFERRVIEASLSRYDGNRTRISEHLGIPRKTLQRKIKKYGLA